MIADHEKASAQMKQAVGEADSSMSVPTELDAKHQAMIDELQNASDFDQSYIELQTKGHEDAVALFTSYSSNGEEGPVRNLAGTLLPTLEQHLAEVQNL